MLRHHAHCELVRFPSCFRIPVPSSRLIIAELLMLETWMRMMRYTNEYHSRSRRSTLRWAFLRLGFSATSTAIVPVLRKLGAMVEDVVDAAGAEGEGCKTATVGQTLLKEGGYYMGDTDTRGSPTRYSPSPEIACRATNHISSRARLIVGPIRTRAMHEALPFSYSGSPPTDCDHESLSPRLRRQAAKMLGGAWGTGFYATFVGWGEHCAAARCGLGEESLEHEVSTSKKADFR